MDTDKFCMETKLCVETDTKLICKSTVYKWLDT